PGERDTSVSLQRSVADGGKVAQVAGVEDRRPDRPSIDPGTHNVPADAWKGHLDLRQQPFEDLAGVEADQFRRRLRPREGNHQTTIRRERQPLVLLERYDRQVPRRPAGEGEAEIQSLGMAGHPEREGKRRTVADLL